MIPVERLRAMLRLLGHDELTPIARRMLDALCDEYETDSPSGPLSLGKGGAGPGGAFVRDAILREARASTRLDGETQSYPPEDT